MLPKIPDRRKTYYRITNMGENHNGLQFHDGLVIDPKKFNNNPKNFYAKGSIYFTTKEYLHRFLKYGCWIRPIKIPSHTKIILDLTGDKYRANKLIFKPRKSLDFYFNKLFDKETFPREDYQHLTQHHLKYFNKWFDKKTFPEKYYWRLAKYHLEYFSTWFDKKTFPEKEYWCLAKYCSKYFNVWFSKKTFPKKHYWYLAKHCLEYFNIWFSEKTFPKKECWCLAKYCSEYFNVWFSKKTFPEKDYWYLNEYCSKYKHIWSK